MGVAGESGVVLLEETEWESTSLLRKEGEGDEEFLGLLLARSRSASFSLYAVAGLCGLLDWYLWSFGSATGFSGEEGEGLREETWVMVGELARQISVYVPNI